MIERVARAIAESEGRTDWQDCLAAARAAVAALSEPTLDMLSAAIPEELPDFGELPDDYRAMMRFVLEQPAPPPGVSPYR